MLIDIEMPRLSGVEVIRRIRAASPPLCNVPIVALTAYVMREHREPIVEAGADGIIAKPIVSIDAFADDVLRFIVQRRAAASYTDIGVEVAPINRAESPITSVSCGELIERATLVELAKSIGPEAMDELMNRVFEDLGSAGDQVMRGLAAGDLLEVRRATHIMISVAGAIGALPLLQSSQRLNEAAHDADLEEVQAESGRMIELLERVRAIVHPQLVR